MHSQDVGWGWRDKTHINLTANNVKHGVSVSSDWSRQEVMGLEAGEVAGDRSGQDRLYGAEGLGHGRNSMNWTEAGKERKVETPRQVGQKHFVGV